MRFQPWALRVLAIAATAVLFSFSASDLYAKAGRGVSSGSRGSYTYSPAPSTNTAPAHSGTDRTLDHPAPARRSARPRPRFRSPPAFFGRGLLGGLAFGLLGAGLFGLLLGHGFGGMAGLFGLLMQAALIGGLVWLALRLIRGPAPAYAGNSPSPRQGLDFGNGSRWRLRVWWRRGRFRSGHAHRRLRRRWPQAGGFRCLRAAADGYRDGLWPRRP